MATISTVFTGTGALTLSVPSFYANEESVYHNGLKLTRNIHYTISGVDPLDANAYTEIVLDASVYAGELGADHLVEVITYVKEASQDSTLQDILSKVEDIATATFGSWRWDKGEGILTMYDRSGAQKFKFNVTDSADSAVRERRQDLEA